MRRKSEAGPLQGFLLTGGRDPLTGQPADIAGVLAVRQYAVIHRGPVLRMVEVAVLVEDESNAGRGGPVGLAQRGGGVQLMLGNLDIQWF